MFIDPQITRSGHPDGPTESSVHVMRPDELESEPVRFAARHWNRLRGTRRFPGRDEISPRDIAGILRDIVLIRVLDDGADFEYRIVGDAHIQAHGINFINMRLSQIERRAGYGSNTRATYEFVRTTGEPFAVRGWIGRDVPESKFAYFETAFLPLGTGDKVDHLLVVTSYAPRNGTESLNGKNR